MFRSGVVAIVDLIDELVYFSIKYRVKVSTLQDMIEYLLICKINAIITNRANSLHGISDISIDSDVFYLEDIDTLSDEMGITLSCAELIDLFEHLEHSVSTVKLGSYWDTLCESSMDINDYSIRWFRTDLHVRVGE